MRKSLWLLIAVAVAACDLSTEAEVRSQSQDFQQVAQWSSSIAGAPLSGSLQVREYGSYGEATITISGAPAGRVYQWRIFRGDCSEATPALHATIQSYPDLVTDASGAATMERTLGGALNTPAGEYSVRLRNGTTTTNWNGSGAIACGNLQKS